MERSLKIRRIKFLASRRSSQEMEILLGKLIENIDLDSLEDEELDRIISFLLLLDTDIKDYIYGLKEVPKEFEDIVLKISSMESGKIGESEQG